MYIKEINFPNLLKPEILYNFNVSLCLREWHLFRDDNNIVNFNT